MRKQGRISSMVFARQNFGWHDQTGHFTTYEHLIGGTLVDIVIITILFYLDALIDLVLRRLQKKFIVLTSFIRLYLFGLKELIKHLFAFERKVFCVVDVQINHIWTRQIRGTIMVRCFLRVSHARNLVYLVQVEVILTICWQILVRSDFLPSQSLFFVKFDTSVDEQ